MKHFTAALLFLAPAGSLAFGQSIAHVIGTQSGIRPSGSWACFYEVRIDNLTYTAVKSGRCRNEVATDADLPYVLDGRYLRLTRSDGKELKLEIQGTHE
jgi:hypothetical protein